MHHDPDVDNIRFIDHAKTRLRHISSLLASFFFPCFDFSWWKVYLIVQQRGFNSCYIRQFMHVHEKHIIAGQ